MDTYCLGQVSESRTTRVRPGREGLPNLLAKIPNVRFGIVFDRLLNSLMPESGLPKGGLQKVDT